MIETGLQTLLLAQPGITAIAKPQTVGGVQYSGVFNEYPPEFFKPPFLLIAQTDLDPLVALDGTYGLRFTDFDFDSYSRSYPEALALAQAVEDFLKDYSGPAGADDTVKAVIYESRRYDEIFEDEGSDVRQHIISLSFQIQHQPSH